MEKILTNTSPPHRQSQLVIVAPNPCILWRRLNQWPVKGTILSASDVWSVNPSSLSTPSAEVLGRHETLKSTVALISLGKARWFCASLRPERVPFQPSSYHGNRPLHPLHQLLLHRMRLLSAPQDEPSHTWPRQIPRPENNNRFGIGAERALSEIQKTRLRQIVITFLQRNFLFRARSVERLMDRRKCLWQ